MLYLTFEYKSETSTVATCIHVSLLYKNNNFLVYNCPQSHCVRKDVNMDLDTLTYLSTYAARRLPTSVFLLCQPSLLSFTAGFTTWGHLFK